MVLAQGLGDEDRQASWDEKGDRGTGASVGRDHAPHLGYVYYAENQIIKSLPKLIEKATNRDLTKGLKDHLEETNNQIARLDQIFKKLGQEPQGVQCPAIDGLIQEADEIAGEVADKDVLDAAIVGAAQAVEHYESLAMAH